MTRKIEVSLPEGSNPETAGLAVEINEEHPMKGDFSIVNFWSGSSTRVHVDKDEIGELIEALKEVSDYE